ncbi:MAG: lysine exporter protein (LysE/YggA) [uncultured bacterium]|nr:MAG: lysine exporter protein (LysE/YggA) [uncultured bacterium]OGJ47816.1 MAG: hypothetical protein A2244_04250 [Candidatus Peregrinibacteria bacterium RIFOXYA2_FULL_41_18]OGJ48372.1 MAG: hypothetical protein A2344_05200 [Candidatus Peregrinibacteria bacterium RIFOXYB12_FULL_41_12]OGJ53011.1 MAG: hypothetical protein A2448_04370 [Candidatus Peregrinibacteria bacterium RIFOXYC2_FULL_41_22]OGJ55221.1 MAG: hypothetical protein A2336_03560 [Candidatus Peregrinibacteria bacterium RIFOXYB2_FULL_41
MIFLIKGLLIGFTIAMSIGPIALLCIARTLKSGRLAGFSSGMGAATADGFYAMVAGLGVATIIRFLGDYKSSFFVFSGLFLMILGVKIFLSEIPPEKISASGKDYLKNYFSTFALTIVNPMTILSFIAVFGTLGIGSDGDDHFSVLSISIFVLGAFLGSALWYLILCTGIEYLSKKFSSKSLTVINRVSGIVIWIFGILTILSIF